MSAYAIIPARGGSKSIPLKNILNLGDFPLIAYSIAAAKLSGRISRVIVSTDSHEIADIAMQYGAEVPFLRPKEISGDFSTDREFALHALQWLKANEGAVPDYLVHLRPTSPLRNPEHIDQCLELIENNTEATSLRSAHEAEHTPYKWFAKKGPYFEGLFPSDIRPEYHNLPRQEFPSVYKPNGYVDILKSTTILNTPGFHGDKILAYISPDTGDIDFVNDLKYVERKLETEDWLIYKYLQDNYYKI
jgi:CMP-N-acetylneuraminic acid synthetase